jgi:hypothetical protein
MMRSKRQFAVLVLLLSLAATGSSLAQQTSSPERLTIEQLMDIKHPSEPVWSPDGRRASAQTVRASPLP